MQWDGPVQAAVKHELAASGVQIIPAATLVGVHVAGMTLPEWAAVAGIVFIIFQAAHLAWVWIHEYRAKNGKGKDEQT